MKWKKVSPELNRFLEEHMAPYPADRRAMFGASTYFVNGNMFAGVHEDRLILRLSEADRKKIMALFDEVALFEPMEGRPMKEYVTLPEPVYSHPDVVNEWLRRSWEYGRSLPPKVKPPVKGRGKS